MGGPLMPWIGRPLMKLKNSQETEPPGDYNKLINVGQLAAAQNAPVSSGQKRTSQLRPRVCKCPVQLLPQKAQLAPGPTASTTSGQEWPDEPRPKVAQQLRPKMHQLASATVGPASPGQWDIFGRS